MTAKEGLWRQWRRSMGKLSSESDLSVARSWFEELWQAGYDAKGIPCARPLAFDELQVYELGAKAGRAQER